jgi:hypothetical protein
MWSIRLFELNKQTKDGSKFILDKSSILHLPSQIDQAVVQEYHEYVKVDKDLKPSEKEVLLKKYVLYEVYTK